MCSWLPVETTAGFRRSSDCEGFCARWVLITQLPLYDKQAFTSCTASAAGTCGELLKTSPPADHPVGFDIRLTSGGLLFNFNWGCRALGMCVLMAVLLSTWLVPVWRILASCCLQSLSLVISITVAATNVDLLVAYKKFKYADFYQDIKVIGARFGF